ncbi:hypothetical protein BTVI_60859 [Pitangus sulphuratus]|nr:hypothetical protein BTVI_60859 [Pitangus sulphuratus]
MVNQLCPRSPWRSMAEQRSTHIPWRTTQLSRWMPKRSYDPVGSPDWNRLLAGLQGKRSPHWSRFSGTTCGPVGTHPGATLQKGPKMKQFLKNCSPLVRFMLEKFMEDCFLSEGPYTGAEEKCEEEREAETCEAPTKATIPHLPLSPKVNMDKELQMHHSGVSRDKKIGVLRGM